MPRPSSTPLPISFCACEQPFRVGLSPGDKTGKPSAVQPALGHEMLELLQFISYLLTLYVYIVIAMAILSWLIAFNVVNTRNPIVHMIAELLYRLTEPALRPIRNLLPNPQKLPGFIGHLLKAVCADVHLRLLWEWVQTYPVIGY